MRRGMLIFAMAGLVTTSGCSDDDVPVPGDGIYSDVDSVVQFCGSESYYVSFGGTAPLGGRYYWAGLIDADTVVLASEPVHLSEGVFDSADLVLTNTFLSAVQAGRHQISVFGTDLSTDVGNPLDRAVEADAGWVEVGDLDWSQPSSCCTRAYAYAQIVQWDVPDSQIVGARCSILTVYGNKVCGDPPEDTTSTHSIVGVTVDYDTVFVDYYGNSQSNAWALTAVGKVRFSFGSSGSDSVYEANIAEMAGYRYDKKIDIYGPKPIHGTNHEYRVELDTTTGEWHHYYDYSRFETTRADPVWQQVKGTKARWGGEVLGLESDMPGTNQNRCVLSNAQFQKAGGLWVNTHFTFPPDRGWIRTDVSEWRIGVVDDQTVEIWDVNPRP